MRMTERNNTNVMRLLYKLDAIVEELGMELGNMNKVPVLFEFIMDGGLDEISEGLLEDDGEDD